MSTVSVRHYAIQVSRKGGDGRRLIFSISHKGERVIYYPGIVVREHEWDVVRREVVHRYDSEGINQQLYVLEKRLRDLAHSLIVRYGRLTRRHFRDELAKIQLQSVRSLTEDFIAFMEARHDAWSHTTFLKCRSFYRWLERFVGYYASFVSLESVDLSFMRALAGFMRAQGLATATVYSYMNLMKWFLHQIAEERAMVDTSALQYKLSELEPSGSETPLYVYLEPDEVSRIFSSNPTSRRMEHIRNLFSLMAFTGLTVGEIREIQKKDFLGESLKVRGRRMRTIPLNEQALAILNSYESVYFRHGYLLPRYSLVSMNAWFRELVAWLGITRPVGTYRRGKLVTGPLNELITIQSARYSFVELAGKAGVSLELIRSWSGIRKPERFMNHHERPDAWLQEQTDRLSAQIHAI